MPRTNAANATNIDELRRILSAKHESPRLLNPHRISAEIRDAVNHAKEEFIQRVILQTRYQDGDVRELWSAADRFLGALPSIASFHSNLTEFENRNAPKGLWNFTTELKPLGTILVCLPANAVIPLGIILPAALAASGNRLVFAVSSDARESGIPILECINGAIGDTLHVWKGSVREAVEGLIKPHPVIDALYYMGASKQFGEIAKSCATAGVSLIYEGEGRGVAIVDETLSDTELRFAAKELVNAKCFCLGRMCSSPNAVLVHEENYASFIKYYHNECLARSLGGKIENLLSASTIDAIGNLSNMLGIYTPDIGTDNDHPFYWETTLETALNASELFCPGVLIAPIPNIDSCLAALSGQRFRMQVSLFSNNQDRLRNLVSVTHFARYCSGMNPANQDAVLPWGNYGRSGYSDVLDFYRKGLRRILIDGTSPFLASRGAEPCLIPNRL